MHLQWWPLHSWGPVSASASVSIMWCPWCCQWHQCFPEVQRSFTVVGWHLWCCCLDQCKHWHHVMLTALLHFWGTCNCYVSHEYFNASVSIMWCWKHCQQCHHISQVQMIIKRCHMTFWCTGYSVVLMSRDTGGTGIDAFLRSDYHFQVSHDLFSAPQCWHCHHMSLVPFILWGPMAPPASYDTGTKRSCDSSVKLSQSDKCNGVIDSALGLTWQKKLYLLTFLHIAIVGPLCIIAVNNS